MFTRFAISGVNPQQTARERNYPTGLAEQSTGDPNLAQIPSIRSVSLCPSALEVVCDRPILGMLKATGASIRIFTLAIELNVSTQTPPAIPPSYPSVRRAIFTQTRQATSDQNLPQQSCTPRFTHGADSP
jgi:hypothetical protein